MPEQFSPAWEYWEPNTEVAALFEDTTATRGFEALIDYQEDGHKRSYIPGIRFGRGNPDWFRARFAPVRPEPECEPIPSRLCPTCGWLFAPDRRSRIYCSDRCYKRPGGAREYPDLPCEECGALFRPRDGTSRFCSRHCRDEAQRARAYDCGCPVCGREVVPSGRGNSKAKVYCSRRCNHVATLRRGNLKRRLESV